MSASTTNPICRSGFQSTTRPRIMARYSCCPAISIRTSVQRYIKLDENFIGRDILAERLDNGLKKNLYGIEMIDRGIPRSGYKVFYNDLEVGYITSGTLSPSLQKSIGLCLIDEREYSSGNLFVEMRGQLREAEFSEIPFYKNQN